MRPVMVAFGKRVSPRIVCAVTLLPDPDSPTTPSVFRASSESETPSTAWTTPSIVLKETCRSSISSSAIGYPYVTLGSRKAYRMSTARFAKTMKKAPKRTVPWIAGRSEFTIAS